MHFSTDFIRRNDCRRFANTAHMRLAASRSPQMCYSDLELCISVFMTTPNLCACQQAWTAAVGMSSAPHNYNGLAEE
jgi:hypothetical protein